MELQNSIKIHNFVAIEADCRCGVVPFFWGAAECRTRSFAACGACGRGFEWIVGPGMLGIAAAKLFAHLEVGGLPEVGKVLCELNRLETGG